MITFEEEKHKYFKDGVPIPGVNEILDEMGFGLDVPDSLMPMIEHKSEIGTAVHKAIHLDLLNDLDEESIPELMGYVKAFRKWKKSDFISIEWCELIIDSQLGYCGRGDLGAVIGDLTAYVDIKTSNGHPRVNRLKTAAYNLILGYQKRGCLYLSVDGEFDWDEHDENIDYEIWKSLVAAFHWKKPRYSKDKVWQVANCVDAS